MKKITILLCLIIVSCGAIKKSVNTERIEILKPEINQKTISEISETLIEKEIGYKYDAIKIKILIKAKPYYIKREIKVNEILINDSQTSKHLLFSSSDKKYGIAFPKKGGNPEMFVNNDGVQTFPLKDAVNFEKIKVPVTGKEYFKQEFIYNGKVGNGLKFIYREYADDTARPAFTQDLQYDLSESDVIGFKGLRIKINNATNTKIEYIVLSNFNK